MEKEPLLEATSTSDYGTNDRPEEATGDDDTPLVVTRTSKFSCSKLRLSACQIVLVVLAVLTIVLGVAMLAGGYQAYLNHELREQLVIQNGSKSYSLWKTTPVPLTLKLYVFNLSNPLEFQNGFSPIVEEVGPYVWREYHEKQNISFHPNATVTYLQKRWWVWDQEASGNHRQDDPIVALNTIAITIAYTMSKHIFGASIVNEAFKFLNESLFVTTTARNLLFDGVEDPLLNWVQKNFVAKNGSYHWLLPVIEGTALTKFDKFAWFYKRNQSLTYDGLFNIMTGEDTLDNLGRIDNWNGRNETSFYSRPCNELTGSAGELFSPYITQDNVTFFSSDLCMSANLFYKKDVTDYDGVTAYRYWGTNHTFSNGTTDPGHECFCVGDTCAPMGLLNAESCRMGAPAFVSFPHFYAGDPFLQDAVKGMAPDEEKHAFFLDVVPELGVPAAVSVRLQINLHVTPSSTIKLLNDVPDVYLPMLWFEIQTGMTPDIASQMKTLLFFLNSPVAHVVIWAVMIGVAVLVILLVLAFAFWKRKNQVS